MAPVSKYVAGIRDAPPSNSAQLGMGWNIATGTVDLGLGLYDAIIMVGEWIRDFARRRKLEAKKENLRRKGQRPRKIQPRSIENITYLDHLTNANWT